MNTTIKVSRKDLPVLRAYSWRVYPSGAGYAVASINRKMVYLHRFLLGAKKGESVDHKNGDKADNRRSNLRLCSHGENRRNNKLYSNNKSGLKGVSWRKDLGKWQAGIRIHGKEYALGLFSDKMDAGKAYDNAAIKRHGKFARTNASMGLLVSAIPNTKPRPL